MKNVVVIGGGHGQAAVLRGIKDIDSIHLTTIVTVADDGGSTGKLRRDFQIPAMGDIRGVMIALAESESLLSTLMNYRFDETSETMGGHNLGNIILTALTQSTGSFMDAISMISKVLKVKGNIVPSTTQVITLYAIMEDGTIVRGESNIPKVRNHIQKVYYNEPVKATEGAIQAIYDADYIVYGAGSLYTSILPNIIIDDIKQAIQQSKAKKIYFCNPMTQSGETEFYTVEDHVKAIEDHVQDKSALKVCCFPRFGCVIILVESCCATDSCCKSCLISYGNKCCASICKSLSCCVDLSLVYASLVSDKLVACSNEECF